MDTVWIVWIRTFGITTQVNAFSTEEKALAFAYRDPTSVLGIYPCGVDDVLPTLLKAKPLKLEAGSHA